MKWGTLYSANYVNALYRAVRQNLSYDFTFYCFTEDATGLDPKIVVLGLPEFTMDGLYQRGGNWPKLGVFQRDRFPGEDYALFLDLDIVILKSLDKFVDKAKAEGGLHILREWNPILWSLVPLWARPDRGPQSSIFAWKISDFHYIYDDFSANPEQAVANSIHDQDHLGKVVKNRTYWPHDWVLSFKRHCIPYFPLNMVFTTVPKPERPSIVVFHGQPRPHEVSAPGDQRWGTSRRFGRGPVAWVQAHMNSEPPRS